MVGEVVSYLPLQPGLHKTLVKNQDNTFTVTDKDGTVETFNINGRLAYIDDANGNRITFTYDGSEPNKLLYITDASGRTTSFTYDNCRRIHTITDGAGRIYTYTYDENDFKRIDGLTVLKP